MHLVLKVLEQAIVSPKAQMLDSPHHPLKWESTFQYQDTPYMMGHVEILSGTSYSYKSCT